jgi:hypothetical protein
MENLSRQGEKWGAAERSDFLKTPFKRGKGVFQESLYQTSGERGLPLWPIRFAVYASQRLFSSFIKKTSARRATLAIGGWLILTLLGLSPDQMYVAYPGARRGRTASYLNRPLTDPGVRNSRTGLLTVTRFRILTAFSFTINSS